MEIEGIKRMRGSTAKYLLTLLPWAVNISPGSWFMLCYYRQLRIHDFCLKQSKWYDYAWGELLSWRQHWFTQITWYKGYDLIQMLLKLMGRPPKISLGLGAVQGTAKHMEQRWMRSLLPPKCFRKAAKWKRCENFIPEYHNCRLKFSQMRMSD